MVRPSKQLIKEIRNITWNCPLKECKNLFNDGDFSVWVVGRPNENRYAFMSLGDRVVRPIVWRGTQFNRRGFKNALREERKSMESSIKYHFNRYFMLAKKLDPNATTHNNIEFKYLENLDDAYRLNVIASERIDKFPE